MVHTICTPQSGEKLPYLQRLWRILFAPNIDSRGKLKLLCELETAELDLKCAFLSSINLENETERFEMVQGPHELLHAGMTVPLSKTYCRQTIAEPEGTLAISNALAEGWGDDPAYETFGFGSYLGTTVHIDDNLYGTLCFANAAPRDEPIRDEEKTLLEMHGSWVEYTVILGDEPLGSEIRTDAIEGDAVSSEAIDSMMSALKSRTRREVLMALLGDTTDLSLATLERQVNDENARIRLLHIELPKLAGGGYIQWDRSAATISKGPKYSEVEPLVQLLNEYSTEFCR